jgi:hypothetical protein
MVLAVFFSDHAALRMIAGKSTDAIARKARARLLQPIISFARLETHRDPQAGIPVSAPGPNDARLLAHAAVPSRMAAKVAAPADPDSLIVLPELADIDVPPALPTFAEPERLDPFPPDLESGSVLTKADRATVVAALSRNLSPDMLRHFDLFLYVSKAKTGPLAQRLYVFRKDGHGTLQMVYDWAASTGREAYEVSPLGVRAHTVTPAGFYELDPHRMYRDYHSHAWDQAMPFAMFFDWEIQGRETGLAIHAATGNDVKRLGSRASAGCVHLSPAHARMLFELIGGGYRGEVPRFTYDEATRTGSNRGDFMRDGDGDLVVKDGYRVLIEIENLGGTDRTVARE